MLEGPDKVLKVGLYILRVELLVERLTGIKPTLAMKFRNLYFIMLNKKIWSA